MLLQAIVVFIPFFLALIVLFRKSIEQAILSVYLPVILCVPLYDNVKLPALPPLDPGDTAILPIGIWMFATRMRKWRFTRSDVWMGLFGMSCGVALFQREASPTFGFFGLFDFFSKCLWPYMIGKLLIEQGETRTVVVKRIVFLMAIVGFISLYEYRMGTNPFHLIWVKIFPATSIDEFFGQIRWGFTRASGPIRQSEGTGMVFLIGTVLAYWLYKNQKWERKFRFKGHPYTKGALIFAAVCIGMFTCQARGPYIGVILGLVIARISKGRDLKRRMKWTLIFLLIGGVAVYGYGKRYAAADAKIESGDQANAVYRSQMIQNYWPVVQRGGIFGWALEWPIIHKQRSIDNAFLLYGLTQGYAGAGSFILLFLESLLALKVALKKMNQQQDVDFVFCIAGCIVGEIFCLGTVANAAPITQLLFLLIGWSQAVRSSEPLEESEVAVVDHRRYSFRRVFT